MAGNARTLAHGRRWPNPTSETAPAPAPAPAKQMWVKLVYSGFETWFVPSTQGAGIRYQNTSNPKVLGSDSKTHLIQILGPFEKRERCYICVIYYTVPLCGCATSAPRRCSTPRRCHPQGALGRAPAWCGSAHRLLQTSGTSTLFSIARKAWPHINRNRTKRTTKRIERCVRFLPCISVRNARSIYLTRTTSIPPYSNAGPSHFLASTHSHSHRRHSRANLQKVLHSRCLM